MNSIERFHLTEELKRHEGFRKHPYKCSTGHLTIGYGRNLEDKGINKREANTLLQNDIQSAMNGAKNIFHFDRVNNARQAVLINFVFNIGETTARKFKKMIKAIQEEDYEQAAEELLNSRYAQQVGKRAEELAERLRTGKWKDD